MFEGQSVPNLEKVTNFDYTTSRRIRSSVRDGNFLNNKNILDKMGTHPRFHLQRGMRETRNRMKEVLFVVHLRSLVRRDLEVGRERSLNDFLDKSLTKLDVGFLLEAFPDGTSVPSGSILGSVLRQVKSDVGQSHA